MIKLSYLNLFLIIMVPVCFTISKPLLFLNIILQLFLLFRRSKNWETFAFISILWSFLFSGISFSGIRLYDIVLIVGLFHLIFSKKIRMPKGYTAGLICFMASIFFVFACRIDANSLLELSRYIFCSGYFLLFANLDLKKIFLKNHLVEICFANIYYAISIYIQITKGVFKNMTSNYISTDVYIYSSEVRMNGFFTDPNKYMIFCLAILFIVELLLKNREKHMCVCIILTSLVLSFSRTALICIAVYIACEILVWIRNKGQQLFNFSVFVIIILAIVAVLFKQQIVEIVNALYGFTATILGRERTLQVNPTFSQDNRVFVWKLAFQYIKENWIFGHGFLSYENLLPFPTHNTFVSLLLDGGIILLVPFINLFKKLILNSRFDLTISCIMIPMIFLDIGNYRMLYALIGIWSMYESMRTSNGIIK